MTETRQSYRTSPDRLDVGIYRNMQGRLELLDTRPFRAWLERRALAGGLYPRIDDDRCPLAIYLDDAAPGPRDWRVLHTRATDGTVEVLLGTLAEYFTREWDVAYTLGEPPTCEQAIAILGSAVVEGFS